MFVFDETVDDQKVGMVWMVPRREGWLSQSMETLVPGGGWFRNRVCLVAIGATGEASVVLRGWEVCDGETTFVKAKCWRSVVASGKWIVEDDCISVIVLYHSDTIVGVIFCV